MNANIFSSAYSASYKHVIYNKFFIFSVCRIGSKVYVGIFKNEGTN